MQWEMMFRQNRSQMEEVHWTDEFGRGLVDVVY